VREPPFDFARNRSTSISTSRARHTNSSSVATSEPFVPAHVWSQAGARHLGIRIRAGAPSSVAYIEAAATGGLHRRAQRGHRASGGSS
jgi:hypothetical protein